MRIGIDARFYGPKSKGLGRYTQKLIQELEKIDQENDYYIFLTADNWKDFQPQNPHFHKILAPYRWYTWREQLFMPLKVWSCKLDLMHWGHFNVPLLTLRPFIVTIHDLILMRFSTNRSTILNPLIYKVKNWAYRLVITLAVKRAWRIIAVSHFTAQDLVRQFKISPQKIIVTYEGISHFNILCQKDDKKILLGYNITKPYLLYVGNAYPHKNLDGLIKAFQEVTHNLDIQLVLVGEKDYFYERLIKETRELFPALVDKVVFTGYLSDQSLWPFFQQALGYIFPSFYEGFGLPPLEAMAQGTPVISSESTCLKEILGEAALYFDPTDIPELVTKIKQFIEDQDLRERLVSRGWRQAQKYSWSKMAQETLNLYQSLSQIQPR